MLPPRRPWTIRRELAFQIPPRLIKTDHNLYNNSVYNAIADVLDSEDYDGA